MATLSPIPIQKHHHSGIHYNRGISSCLDKLSSTTSKQITQFKFMGNKYDEMSC